MVYVPGIKHLTADAASRYPSGPKDAETLPLPDDCDDNLNEDSPPLSDVLASLRCFEPDKSSDSIDSSIRNCAIGALAQISVTWQRVKNETSSDPDMHQLLELVEQDCIPELRQDLPVKLRNFHQYRHDLIAIDGIILYKERVVIPPRLRPEVITTLHAARQGVQAMLSRATSSIFWPGITSAINEVRANCGDCNRMAPSQANLPPEPMNVPEYPFQYICADYFKHAGSNYLITVDRYTNWQQVERAADGSTGLINNLRSSFHTLSIENKELFQN